MTQPKRPLKVFLCHAHADRDAVRALYTRLTNDGVDVWLDKEKLLPGQDWELEIKKAVREADVVVVCLSKQFNQAGFRQKEVRLALETAMEKPEGEIFIIPVRLEESDTPGSLKKWHWVNLFEKKGYQMLINALQLRAKDIGAKLQVKKVVLTQKTVKKVTDRDKKRKTNTFIEKHLAKVDSKIDLMESYDLINNTKHHVGVSNSRRVKNVSDLMTRQFVTLDLNDGLDVAIRLMAEKSIRHFLIAPPPGGKMWRVLTQSDILLAISSGADLSTIAVAEFASMATVVANPTWTIERLISEMVRNGVKLLPVIDYNNVLVGVVDSMSVINSYR